MVEVNVTLYGVTISETITLGTLPQGFRPRSAIRIPNYTGNVFLDIGGGGVVSLMRSSNDTYTGNIVIVAEFIAT